MTQLGNIFEQADGGAASGDARGRTLRAEVTVPANSLGDDDGFSVEVPLELIGDELVARTPSPHDDGAAMTLRLPASFPDGGTLRLRGQGERAPGGRAGDLLLTVRVDHENAIAPFLPPGAVAQAGASRSLLWVALAAIAGLVGYLAFGT